jgi:hypothetical protein
VAVHNRGHWITSSARDEQRLRDREAELLGSLLVDHKREANGPLNRKAGRPSAVTHSGHSHFLKADSEPNMLFGAEPSWTKQNPSLVPSRFA